MNGKKTTAKAGIGIIDVVQIVFIILKFCKVIDWAWWIVLSPLWGSILFAVICFAIAGLCYYLLRKFD